MTTKLLAIVITLSFLFNIESYAQGYFRAGGGFGIGMNKDAFRLPEITRDSNSLATNAKNIFGSFGQGARFAVAGGYMINPYFGAELQAHYFLGMRQLYASDISPVQTNLLQYGQSSALSLTPSLVVKVPLKSLQLYGRLGINIPVFGHTSFSTDFYNATTQQTTARTLRVNHGFTVGFESSIGLVININNRLGVYAEITYSALRVTTFDAAYTRHITKDTDGNTIQDNLSLLSKAERYIDYQDELTPNSNNTMVSTIDPDRPTNLLTTSYNLNSLSLNIGIQYTFVKKEG